MRDRASASTTRERDRQTENEIESRILNGLRVFIVVECVCVAHFFVALSLKRMNVHGRATFFSLCLWKRSKSRNRNGQDRTLKPVCESYHKLWTKHTLTFFFLKQKINFETELASTKWPTTRRILVANIRLFSDKVECVCVCVGAQKRFRCQKAIVWHMI